MCVCVCVCARRAVSPFSLSCSLSLSPSLSLSLSCALSLAPFLSQPRCVSRCAWPSCVFSLWDRCAFRAACDRVFLFLYRHLCVSCPPSSLQCLFACSALCLPSLSSPGCPCCRLFFFCLCMLRCCLLASFFCACHFLVCSSQCCVQWPRLWVVVLSSGSALVAFRVFLESDFISGLVVFSSVCVLFYLFCFGWFCFFFCAKGRVSCPPFVRHIPSIPKLL